MAFLEERPVCVFASKSFMYRDLVSVVLLNIVLVYDTCR